MPSRRFVLAALPALLLPLHACTSLTPARNEVFDTAVAAALGSDFNGVVLTRAGKAPASLAAYGTADFTTSRAMTTQARFQIGSISKWITAVTVLRLVEQGKLSLDEPVRTYLPELNPDSAARVTLRHLLSNVSGIPDGVMAAFKLDKSVGALPLTPLEAALRFGSQPSRFAPGERFDYSVTNWVVIAAIIERVTASPFPDVVARLVLAPAGARDTGFAPASFETVPDAAVAFTSSVPRERKMPPTGAFAAASGTVYSTAEDLAQLGAIVFDGSLLSAASRETLSRILVPEESYALGGRVRSLELGGRTRTVAYESGSTGGYKAVLMHAHGEGRTVVILNNTDMSQPVLAKAGETLLRGLY